MIFVGGKLWFVECSSLMSAEFVLMNKASKNLVLDLYGNEINNGFNIGVRDRCFTYVRNQLCILEQKICLFNCL